MQGKVAMVTGGGRGIGEASARRLADFGAKVILADLDLASATAVAESLKSEGKEAAAIEFNVADFDHITEKVAAARAIYGRIDVLVNIAGITGYIEDEQLKSGTHIYEMARAASRMVTDSVDSFVRKDLGKARAVQKEDDIVDGLFDTVKNELVGQITEHPDLSGECLDLLMIAKYLERIGDHAVNVAEWVEYSITGAHAGE